MIYILIYLIGFVIMAIVLPRWLSFEEGDFEVIEGEVFYIDEINHKMNITAMVILWPVVLPFLVFFAIMRVLIVISEWFYDRFKD